MMPEFETADNPVPMVAARAVRLGYRLAPVGGACREPAVWHLLDKTDGARIVTGDLDEVNAWLST
ncbi:hypothetical protein [Nocardia wallacei]|uniref:hypothetical protein n=1 Tax=Nocardia wallacei TaxID=480035 RepID=UPI002453A63D|nr:hypothetical protein [Nocardia wallacei]